MIGTMDVATGALGSYPGTACANGNIVMLYVWEDIKVSYAWSFSVRKIQYASR